MLIIILFGFLSLIAITLISIYFIIENHTEYCANEKILLIGVILLVLFGMAFTVCAVSVIIIQIPAQIDYENKMYEKQLLEYRIQNIDSLTTGQELLYKDILAFNNDLRTTKKWANNLWTSWFYNQKIATIDYIELP